ncbi:uncharacterized protein [Spinacia oleracea]|uniref:Uncharacterized protein isoform X2 n=1 Tax=Spinacia oleracea TaxID=3562 RepID=A0A9R0KAY3_SPIOL|nr:uncharacterized protein LOC110803917 isoform X2 [Spinacia oleracea]
MEDLETARIDAVTDSFSLIDVSASDDDFLLDSSSEPSIVDNPGHTGVTINPPSDSLAFHRPRKTGKCNLRKSLAWDSAFFTNAGVLDPEELSSIMEGAETGVNQSPFLPGIQEELRKSTDSVSTFQSDNIESLEADLFCDIRASIQRCSKSSTKENSSGSKIHREAPKNGSSTKIVEPSSHKMAKPKSASNKLNLGVQGPMRTLKPGSKIKPPVNRSREPISLLSRPLKPAGGPSLQVPETTKRMSVGAGRVKPNVKAAVNAKGNGSPLPEASNQVGSRKPVPKAPTLSKISASSSVLNRTATRSSRSSCDSLSSSASEDVQKSQTGVFRKKMDKNVNLPPGSKTRTSTKVVDKVNSQNKGSHLSAYIKSSSKLSSSISPASSISEWSTESCSSTATVNQKQFGLIPCPPSSQDVTADSNVSRNLNNLSSDRALGDHENQVPGIVSQPAKQPSTGSVVSNTRPSSAKPSGLRMPSPNIGFFDGVKAGAKTPTRSALPSSLPRSAAGTFSTSGATSKTRLGISAPKITAAAAAVATVKQLNIDAHLKTTTTRTPFTIKNVSNVVEVRNSPPGSATESLA